MEDKELVFWIKKRLIDLQVMGMDIEHNRPNIRGKEASDADINPGIKKIVDQKIADIIFAAKTLTARGRKVKISLADQQPYIAKRLGKSFEKAGLFKKPQIRRRAIKKIQKKRTLPKRRI